MSYLAISVDTLGEDFVLLIVTVVLICLFNRLLKEKAAIDEEGRYIGLPGVLESSGALTFYWFVCASALGFTESDPSLFKTIAMLIGGMYIAVVSVISIHTLFTRYKNKSES